MKMARFALVGLTALLLVSGVVWAAPASKAMSVHTLEGFVELLITRGIVPEGMVEKARTLARMASGGESSQDIPGVLNAETVEVSVSQLITVSDLTFKEGEEVYGILVLAKNTSQAPVMLEATRRCQIVYRIYEGNTLRYDSATKEACEANEKVTYMLDTGATRMFEVKHEIADYALPVGTYRMEIEYPGYGKGERVVTIVA